MKIGDRVRFLSETGGGKVAGFKGNIVLVEDEDGFQIPTPLNDVVVVDDEDYSTTRIVSNKMAQNAASQQHEFAPKSDGRSIKSKMSDGADDSQEEDDIDPADKEISFRKPAEERKGGNQISAYLAFVPVDIKEVTQTRFETYFVNDSNYYIQYTYLTAEGTNWNVRAHGEVEPNTKLFIEEFSREALNELGHIAIQMFAYKLDRSFLLKPTFDAQFRIDPVKFYKLHTFQSNDFFETPALLFTIVENDRPVRPLVVDPKKLKEEMYQRDADDQPKKTYTPRYDDGKHKGNPFQIHRRGDDDVVVVDLHADEVLDNTAGMTPADILNYQLKVFRDSLADYAGKKGQKIVFIHGKGEGVLRRAIINDLTYRYKSYTYQDASFQEYGYGATQVTIK
jgi:hypothetical protein